jgi:hypothetical protein
MRTAIATVAMGGLLGQKLEAIAAAGFDGWLSHEVSVRLAAQARLSQHPAMPRA